MQYLGGSPPNPDRTPARLRPRRQALRPAPEYQRLAPKQPTARGRKGGSFGKALPYPRTKKSAPGCFAEVKNCRRSVGRSHVGRMQCICTSQVGSRICTAHRQSNLSSWRALLMNPALARLAKLRSRGRLNGWGQVVKKQTLQPWRRTHSFGERGIDAII